MAVEFITVPYKIPSKPETPLLYFLRAKMSGKMGLRRIMEEASRMSTVSPGNTVAVMETLKVIIPRALLDNYIVDLGDLGSFYLTINGEGKTDPNDITARDIKSYRIVFRPCKGLREKLYDVHYKKSKR